MNGVLAGDPTSVRQPPGSRESDLPLRPAAGAPLRRPRETGTGPERSAASRRERARRSSRTSPPRRVARAVGGEPERPVHASTVTELDARAGFRFRVRRRPVRRIPDREPNPPIPIVAADRSRDAACRPTSAAPAASPAATMDRAGCARRIPFPSSGTPAIPREAGGRVNRDAGPAVPIVAVDRSPDATRRPMSAARPRPTAPTPDRAGRFGGFRFRIHAPPGDTGGGLSRYTGPAGSRRCRGGPLPRRRRPPDLSRPDRAARSDG